MCVTIFSGKDEMLSDVLKSKIIFGLVWEISNRAESLLPCFGRSAKIFCPQMGKQIASQGEFYFPAGFDIWNIGREREPGSIHRIKVNNKFLFFDFITVSNIFLRGGSLKILTYSKYPWKSRNTMKFSFRSENV